MSILDSLSSGPKTYAQLKGAENLDYQLRGLLEKKQIQRVYDALGVCRFSLPVEPPEDQPYEKIEYRVPQSSKREHKWKPYKVVNGKVVNGRRERDVEKPSCPQCHKRWWRSRFVYGDRLNILCFECGGRA